MDCGTLPCVTGCRFVTLAHAGAVKAMLKTDMAGLTNVSFWDNLLAHDVTIAIAVPMPAFAVNRRTHLSFSRFLQLFRNCL